MTRRTLVLAVSLAACGDDDDGSKYTLDQALLVPGIDGSDDRADVLFRAACEEREPCTHEPVDHCIDIENQMWSKGKTRGVDETCRDAVLDLYTCFSTNDCNTFETACEDLTASAGVACQRYVETAAN